MNPDWDRTQLPLRWGFILLVYAAITLVFIGQNVTTSLSDDAPINWNLVGYSEALYWTILAWLTPIIIYGARRFPIVRNKLMISLPVHVILCIIVVTAHIFAYYYLQSLMFGSDTFSEITAAIPAHRAKFMVSAFALSYKYCLIIAIYYTFDYYRRYRRQEQTATSLKIHTSQLEARLSQAKLSALRSQLHPHFLFNTLNAISILIDEDPDKANAMLHHLSDLLRESLDRAGEEKVPLHREIAFIKRYLQIEQIRFEDRLRLQLDIEPETLDILVPSLILQPIVENAIKHGIARSSTAGLLQIKSERQNGDLILTVTDDGRGFPDDGFVYNGIGLSNTRSRLEKYFGNTNGLILSNNPDGGAKVTLSIPINNSV